MRSEKRGELILPHLTLSSVIADEDELDHRVHPTAATTNRDRQRHAGDRSPGRTFPRHIELFLTAKILNGVGTVGCERERRVLDD